MGYMIETEKLTKRFGNLVAVDHVDLKVKEGEIFALLGPNGAGKTTTINMLTTLLKPDEGTAKVAGFDVVKEALKVRQSIGIVFQDMTVDRNLTAYENLYIHGKVYGLRGHLLKDKIREALEFVELQDWKDVELKKFSGGMIRRLEIARGLMHLPKVLFLDEPTLGLDPQTRAHIWEYIEKLRAEHGITILLTTHYMEEAEKLSDRVAIIDHGKIIALGTPNELIDSVGGDVIYLRLSSPMDEEKFLASIESNGIIKKIKKIRPGYISLTVEKAPEITPKIFDIAHEKGIKIREIVYHRPTLEDVFLHLTGRKIREETWSPTDHMRAMMMRRFRR
ncbi:MAG: ATP-binding cassette domain-containing protein [Candidatus Njordarchaeia archaeon]